jgi:uncharacterized protein with NRDE domain
MCLAAFALGLSARFPLVIASNRDEFHARPTEPLDVWLPSGARGPILAGRDLEAGGSWFGLDGRGRLALLTNLRDPTRQRAGAPTRGALVTDWLTADADADAERWWPPVRGAGHNGFNLIAADLAAGRWHWLHSDEAAPRPLGPGLYGLSNGRLDEPWPKVVALKAAMARALEAATATGTGTATGTLAATVDGQVGERHEVAAAAPVGGRDQDRAPPSPTPADALAERLFAALHDERLAPDAELPATGVPLALERLLSAVFIRTPDGRYGTRCSTVLVAEAATPDGAGAWTTTLIERSHGADGQPGPTRRARWRGWPHTAALPTVDTLPPPSA